MILRLKPVPAATYYKGKELSRIYYLNQQVWPEPSHITIPGPVSTMIVPAALTVSGRMTNDGIGSRLVQFQAEAKDIQFRIVARYSRNVDPSTISPANLTLWSPSGVKYAMELSTVPSNTYDATQFPDYGNAIAYISVDTFEFPEVGEWKLWTQGDEAIAARLLDGRLVPAYREVVKYVIVPYVAAEPEPEPTVESDLPINTGWSSDTQTLIVRGELSPLLFETQEEFGDSWYGPSEFEVDATDADTIRVSGTIAGAPDGFGMTISIIEPYEGGYHDGDYPTGNGNFNYEFNMAGSAGTWTVLFYTETQGSFTLTNLKLEKI